MKILYRDYEIFNVVMFEYTGKYIDNDSDNKKRI